jgi:hypothetical protein
VSAFQQSGLKPGDNVLSDTVVHKLLRLIPAAGAMAYPFLLDGFHLAVSPASDPASPIRWLGAALCLFAATAAPFLGLIWAFRMSRATPSPFERRARRLAYVTIGAPPLFVLTGVVLGLLHIHLSDELVWVFGRQPVSTSCSAARRSLRGSRNRCRSLGLSPNGVSRTGSPPRSF